MKVVQEVLENAIDQQGRPYQELFAVLMQIEADQTFANKDQQIFFNQVKCTNILLASNHPQSLVIGINNVNPGWTVTFFLKQLFDVISICKSRSLLLFNYASHGGLNTNRDIIFYA